jgi:hypothetical protein
LIVAAAGMLAKQRGQGKLGNILLAMPQTGFSLARESHVAKFGNRVPWRVRRYALQIMK